MNYDIDTGTPRMYNTPIDTTNTTQHNGGNHTNGCGKKNRLTSLTDERKIQQLKAIIQRQQSIFFEDIEMSNIKNVQKADQLLNQFAILPLQKKHAKAWLQHFGNRQDCAAIREYHAGILETTQEELGYRIIDLLNVDTQRSEADLFLIELLKLQLLSEQMSELETQKEICDGYPHHLWKEYSALKAEVNLVWIKISNEITELKSFLMKKLELILKDDENQAE